MRALKISLACIDVQKLRMLEWIIWHKASRNSPLYNHCLLVFSRQASLAHPKSQMLDWITWVKDFRNSLLCSLFLFIFKGKPKNAFYQSIVRCDQITDLGLYYLKRALQELSSLKHLDLFFPTCKTFTNLGLDHLKQVFKKLPSLKFLSVDFS